MNTPIVATACALLGAAALLFAQAPGQETQKQMPMMKEMMKDPAMMREMCKEMAKDPAAVKIMCEEMMNDEKAMRTMCQTMMQNDQCRAICKYMMAQQEQKPQPPQKTN